MFEILFVFFIVLFFVIAFFTWLSNTLIGSERWCEKCDTWNTMKLDRSHWICEKCGHPNQANRGCPRCGWYARFENRFVRRAGPYSKEKANGYYLKGYKETWNCPVHGDYVIFVAASESIDYGEGNSFDDDENYDDASDNNGEDEYSDNMDTQY